jgi:hypothetical protein
VKTINNAAEYVAFWANAGTPTTMAQARSQRAKIAAWRPLPGDADPLPDDWTAMLYRLEAARSRIWLGKTFPPQTLDKTARTDRA